MHVQGLTTYIQFFFFYPSSSSYLHVEWGTFQKLIKGDKRFDQKLKRYKQKQEQLGPFADVSGAMSMRSVYHMKCTYIHTL